MRAFYLEVRGLAFAFSLCARAGAARDWPLTIRLLFAYSPLRRRSNYFRRLYDVYRAVPPPGIRTGNGQHPQGARTRSQRKMELEAARKVRHARLVGEPRRHHSRLVYHDAADGKSRLRTGGRSAIRAAEDRKHTTTSGYVRQGVGGGTQCAQQSLRCRLQGELAAARRRQGDFHYAAHRLPARHGDEPYDSSSRAAHRVSAHAQRPGTGPLRSFRRRVVAAKGSLNAAGRDRSVFASMRNTMPAPLRFFAWKSAAGP